MKKLLIVGAGNVGGYIAYNKSELGNYHVVGFFDDDQRKWGNSLYGLNVLGSVEALRQFVLKSPEETYCVALCIASPSAKRDVVKRIHDLPIQFPSFISSRAWISQNVTVGHGVIVYPGASINFETIVADFVTINMNCAIGHNCKVGNFSTLAPGVNLGGFTSIDEGVSVGIGVSTIQNVHIGKDAVVGGQTMVIRDVAEESTVVGNPARVITKKSVHSR